MKKRVILKLTCCVGILLATSCHHTEQEAKDIAIPIAIQEQLSPYVDFYLNQDEKILHYSYIDCSFGASKEPQTGVITRNLDRNTFSLATTNAHTTLTIEDTYDIHQEDANTHVNLSRKVQHKNDSIGTESGESGAATKVTIVVKTAEPIYFIRPYATECYPIPLCYYSDMEIAWNGDPENTNGVVVIAEWNGISNESAPVDESHAHARIVDDTGSAVLEDGIFDDMPDGALVHLWLLRANIAQFMSETGEEISIAEFLSKVETGEIDIEEVMTDNPEVIMQLQTISIASGAITHLPIFLVREI